MNAEPYPSDLTDDERALIEPLFPGAKRLGRPARYSKRAILDSIFYIMCGGIAWRMMPKCFPPWRICYYYFMVWKRDGVWLSAHEALRDKARLKSGKKAPTAAIIDSQSVKTAGHGGVRGYDAVMKVTGRKRHLLVDRLGLVLLVVVHKADVQDRDGARLVLSKLESSFGWLKLIWADGGYAGKLLDWVADLQRHRAVRLEIVKRSDKASGFKVLPRRGVVERTFGWRSKYRRLSKDYETSVESSEAFMYIAMTRLMLKKIA